MPDPTEPGWRPEYTGADLGPVGSGGRLGAHLYYLYRAGRNEFPQVASVYAGCTRKVHETTGYMEALFDLPGRGMDIAYVRLLELRIEVHDVLRQTALRMEEVGAALVRTADEYAATDEAAADEFANMLDENAEDYQDPPPYVSPPPAVDEPTLSDLQTDRGRLAAADRR